LPHRQASGLFLKDGQYIADIKPDDGRRTIRKLGTVRERALTLFDELLTERGQHDDPLLASYLMHTFLPSQQNLKAYDYAERCVGLVAKWAEAAAPGPRLSGVNRSHVEQLRAHYERFAPRTLNMVTQKFKQVMNYAVDLGVIDANPIARVKQLSVDSRRAKFRIRVPFAWVGNTRPGHGKPVTGLLCAYIIALAWLSRPGIRRTMPAGDPRCPSAPSRPSPSSSSSLDTCPPKRPTRRRCG